MKKSIDQLLLIFGASGDLTSRKLLPSLYELHINGLLPTHFCILGASRTPYSDEEYRDFQRKNFKETIQHEIMDEQEIERFLRRVYYYSFDPMDNDQYKGLSERINQLRTQENIPDRILYYLSVPPSMYEFVTASLRGNGMNKAKDPDGWRKIVVEKPFGTSLESAVLLNKHLCGIFDEQGIFRIDHYLGKETVQNILVLRLSNGIFEPLWNRNYIDSVEIRAAETLGVENRGKYYDTAGALRDMIQNHLMHLLGFVAMESPSVFDPEPIRDEITKVLRAIRPYTRKDMENHIVRGQYEGYRNEPYVSKNSTTETYVAMKFFIDNWRWSDVPFFFITGKRMPVKSSEIIINFKSTPHQLFAGQCSGGSCNKLVIRIQPNEGITLRFGLKEPGAGFKVKQVGMDFHYDSLSFNRLPSAYERLLLDAMLGESMLYSRDDALEASWAFIDPIIKYWKERGDQGLCIYRAGEDVSEEKKITGYNNKTCSCQSNE